MAESGDILLLRPWLMAFTRGGDSRPRDAVHKASEEAKLERASSACRHAGGVRVAARNLLAEPRSPGTEGPHQGSLQEPPRGRSRPTDSLRVIPAAEFVGMGRRFLGIEEHVAVRCPCCEAINVDTRHARICPGAGAQVNQHQPLLHAISGTLKRLGIPHQVESGEPFTAERNFRMDIVIRRGSLRDAPNREYRDKSIRRHPCRPASAGTPARRQC